MAIYIMGESESCYNFATESKSFTLQVKYLWENIAW